MQTGFCNISGNNCFAWIKNCIQQKSFIDYEKELTGGMLFCLEENRFFSGSRSMVTIIVETADNNQHACSVEIIVGGGKISFFPTHAGVERNYVRKTYNHLVDFCNGQDFTISTLEEQ